MARERLAYCERFSDTEIDVLSPGKGVAYCERCSDIEINRRFITRERGGIL